MKKEIEKLKPIVLEINSLEEKIKKLKDEAFPKKLRSLEKEYRRENLSN